MVQAAIFRKEDVVLTSGVDHIMFYHSTLNSPERVLPCKVYCGSCRTPMFDEGRNMLMLFPNLIHFDCNEEGHILDPTEARRRRAAFEPTYVCGSS